MITIPESVAYYWRDPINMAAVNVLAVAVEVPGDLALSEAERFELATLAARRVRVEFWRLLRQLWSATWFEAVRAAFPSARLLTYGEHQGFTTFDPDSDPSVDYAWREQATAGVFDLRNGKRLFTSLVLKNGDCEIGLEFYTIDKDNIVVTSDDLNLGTDWEDDGQQRRVTSPGLLPLMHRDGEVDPEPIAKLASGAIVSLAAAL